MDGRTDGQNIPCILHDIVPLGPLPCSKLENLEKKEKQGKGTADHILTLVDYYSFKAEARLKKAVDYKNKFEPNNDSSECFE